MSVPGSGVCGLMSVPGSGVCGYMYLTGLSNATQQGLEKRSRCV